MDTKASELSPATVSAAGTGDTLMAERRMVGIPSGAGRLDIDCVGRNMFLLSITEGHRRRSIYLTRNLLRVLGGEIVRMLSEAEVEEGERG